MQAANSLLLVLVFLLASHTWAPTLASAKRVAKGKAKKRRGKKKPPARADDVAPEAAAAAREKLDAALASEPKRILAYFERAAALAPSRAAAHYQHAVVLSKLGHDPDEVLAVSRRALAIEPSLAKARYLHATALGQLGRTQDEVLGAFEQALAMIPHSDSSPHRTISLAVLGRHEESVQARRRLAKAAGGGESMFRRQIRKDGRSGRREPPPVCGGDAARCSLGPLPALGDGVEPPTATADSSDENFNNRGDGDGADGGDDRRLGFVQVYGLQNAGTSAMQAELRRLFGRSQLVWQEWKHTLAPVRQRQRWVLNVVVVKDPYWWLHSMRRNPYSVPFQSQAIAAGFAYQGRRFERGLAQLWNAHARLYAHEFPAERTLVFRAVDLLFRWEGVVSTLRRWLRVDPGADFTEGGRPKVVTQNKAREAQARQHRPDMSGGSEHPAEDDRRRSRTLSEAQEFYGDPSRRTEGLSVSELMYMRQVLDPKLMARWGYAHPPLPGASADGSGPDAADRTSTAHDGAEAGGGPAQGPTPARGASTSEL